MHYSYTSDNIRRYFESSAIQHQLRSKGIELIFFDEFSLNSRHLKHIGCALKGNKGHTKMDSSGFSISLLVSLSDVRVYGIMGWSNSVDNNVVRLFVTYLLSFRYQTPSITNSMLALVCDNASEHEWDIGWPSSKKAQMWALFWSHLTFPVWIFQKKIHLCN